jgi:hypothetical protein
MLLIRTLLPLLTVLLALGVLDRGDALAQNVSGPAPVTLTAKQTKSLEELRQMATETQRVYKLPASINVGVRRLATSGLTSYRGVGISYHAGDLTVDPTVLDSPHRLALMGVALGSIVLRAPSTATSLAEAEQERQQRTKEYNAKAVEILVRVKGLLETEALHLVYVWLLARHRAPSTRQASTTELRLCEQIRDLLVRFPQHREWSPKPECAPE